MAAIRPERPQHKQGAHSLLDLDHAYVRDDRTKHSPIARNRKPGILF
jgi:hypothetical protein